MECGVWRIKVWSTMQSCAILYMTIRPKQVETEENGGTPKLNGVPRFVGVRNKRVCKGMRSDTEERLQLQMFGLLCRG